MAIENINNAEVLIVGSGSAGLSAATWLARYGIACKILEKSSGPMTTGQADGVQCRTVEVFESFGISEELLKESCHVIEVAFWSTDATTGQLQRQRTAVDTEIGLSHQPHVILNQARLNGMLIGEMRRSNSQEIDYGYLVKSVEVDEVASSNPDAYCVRVIAEKGGIENIFRAKYVLVSKSDHYYPHLSQWQSRLY
jgi:phenol 2-monooxygenase (NADPH)